jgi:hypothetical protein
MQDWSSFYETLGGAAAALLGLLFVSVSVRAEQILGARHGHSRRIAEQAFQNYLAVLMVSLVSLMPNVDTVSLGIAFLWMLGVWAAWVVIRVHQTLMNWRTETSRVKTVRRYFASAAGFGTLIYAGAKLARGDAGYRQLVPIGAIILLVSATIVSWELLISVVREAEPGSRRDSKE